MYKKCNEAFIVDFFCTGNTGWVYLLAISIKYKITLLVTTDIHFKKCFNHFLRQLFFCLAKCLNKRNVHKSDSVNLIDEMLIIVQALYIKVYSFIIEEKV